MAVQMQRKGVTFSGTGGKVALSAYPTFTYSDPVDVDAFLQVAFELYPDTMIGSLYYTLSFVDSEGPPIGGSGVVWLPDPIDGASTVDGSANNLITVNPLVRVWAGSGGIQVNTPTSHRWIRIGVAAGTSGNCMAIVRPVRLASE